MEADLNEGGAMEEQTLVVLRAVFFSDLVPSVHISLPQPLVADALNGEDAVAPEHAPEVVFVDSN